jgi:tetratricopeptide (TPR) repeat protein
VNARNLGFALVGFGLGLLFGFLLANTLGVRSALSIGQTPNIAQAPKGKSGELTLSEEELRRAIARADAEPQDLELQRSLGRALYLYAAQTGDRQALTASVRLLRRAYEIGATEYDDLIALANALFEEGRAMDRSQLTEARAFYQRALERRANDADAIARIGWTFYFERPPKLEQAIREFRRALSLNSKHELALHGLTVALITAGDLDRAQKALADLERTNGIYPALPDLRAYLEQKKNAGAAIAKP